MTLSVNILGSSPDAPDHAQYLSSYLINGTVAIDAGCLGLQGDADIQGAVRHVFLTHSHADHVASLPVFLENIFQLRPHPVVIHGHEHTLASLQQDVFNDRLWPDFVRLSKSGEAFLGLDELTPENAVEVEGLRITPVLVNHIVPTFGYVVDAGSCAVVFGGDSGPTDRIWQVAGAHPNLRAAFIEASFPNDMEELAGEAKHLTPRLFRAEVDKLPAGVTIVAVHIKTRFRDTVVSELRALDLPNLAIGLATHDFQFS